MFDPSHPKISSNKFKKYDWEDFYRTAEEDIPTDMPTPLGSPFYIYVFVDVGFIFTFQYAFHDFVAFLFNRCC